MDAILRNLAFPLNHHCSGDDQRRTSDVLKLQSFVQENGGEDQHEEHDIGNQFLAGIPHFIPGPIHG